MHLDTRLLRSFLTVARELNFSRAAQELHMSQQALSAQIRRLELAAGATLFQRTTRYVRLTPAGRTLTEYAQEMLDCADRADRALRTASGAEARLLRLGFSIGADLDLTALILAEFARHRPDVTVDVREAGLYDPSAGLKDRDVDAAFVRLPLGGDEVDHVGLVEDPRVLMVHRRHPLAARGSIRFADIAHEPLIVCRTQDARWDDFWLAVDARGGSSPVISHEVGTLDEELLLVATRGALSITAGMAARRPHPPGVTFVPIVDLAPSTVALAWPRADRNPLVAQLAAAAGAVRTQQASRMVAPSPV